MFPWGKWQRNFGWQCKHCGRKYGGGVQLYMCRNCGNDPANEFCLTCASALNFNCPYCKNDHLVKG